MIINGEEILPHAILGFKIRGGVLDGKMLNRDAYKAYTKREEWIREMEFDNDWNSRRYAGSHISHTPDSLPDSLPEVIPEYGPKSYQVTTTIRTAHPDLLKQTQVQEDVPEDEEKFLENIRQDIRQYTTKNLIRL